MSKTEVYNLHPTGWESDPDEEYFKLSTLDYCVGQVFTNWALFFRLSDEDKPRVVSVLKRGLEVTLSQCRQLCGNLEEHPHGGLCFHKHRDSTVEFHVKWLDDVDSRGEYPTFDELEAKHFVSQSLGPMETWCVAPMTYGEKPEARPMNRPNASAFQATFIQGGLVFMMHHHHFGNDVMGWAGEMHQLAENCAAIWKNELHPRLPSWDPACLDLSRITKPEVPEDQRVDGPPFPERHPDHKVGQWLLFHLPKSKTAELKKLAAPTDDSYFISSYDAYMAHIWRLLSKHRAALFSSDPKEPVFWGEAVDMRRRFHNPPMLKRTQGNVVYVAMSTQTDLAPLTVEEVVSTAPLSKLAWYIRQLTNGVTQEMVDAALEAIAPVRDKTSLFLRTDSLPPLSTIATEWRDTDPCGADFGFAKPYALRFPFDTVTAGLAVVYPVRTNNALSGNDEGNEFSIAFEKDITEALINDPEWNKYFEFRGVDAEEQQI